MGVERAGGVVGEVQQAEGSHTSFAVVALAHGRRGTVENVFGDGGRVRGREIPAVPSFSFVKQRPRRAWFSSMTERARYAWRRGCTADSPCQKR